MITRKDALAIGKAVVKSQQKELDFYNNITNTLNDEKSTVISGMTYTVLREIWYDVLAKKVKESFGWDCQNFIAECCKA